MMKNDEQKKSTTEEQIELESTETIMNFDDLDDGSDPNADLSNLVTLLNKTAHSMNTQAASSSKTSHNGTKDETLSDLIKTAKPSLFWIKEFLHEDATLVSPQHKEILINFENDQPRLCLAILELIDSIIIEDLGADIVQHSDFEKKFKGYLIKIEIEINCNQLPTIYYFEDKSLKTYAWSLMDLDFVSQTEIEGYVFFKHSVEDDIVDDENFEINDSEKAHVKFQKNLEKTLKQANVDLGDPAIQGLLSCFQESQNKLDMLADNKEFREFMGIDVGEDRDESEILFMEIAVLLSQKIFFNLQRIISFFM